MALALQPPARLHAIEIAVDVKLEVHRGMIPRPSHVQCLDRLETQLLQIKPLDERLDDTNRIGFVDSVIEASRQQRQLPPIRPLAARNHSVRTSRCSVYKGWTYSITSSARASSVGGTVRPRILAVWLLMTSSTLLDCTTGRSS